MQRYLCERYGLVWDDSIPESIRQEWIQFYRELFMIENTTFERCVKPTTAINDTILVIFSDGLQATFGSVAYCRWDCHDGIARSRLVATKNRVVPIKIVDIVKLELCGALLGTRLRVFLQDEMRCKFRKVHHIVDSEIVKAVVMIESYGFNTFAANRIGEIQMIPSTLTKRQVLITKNCDPVNLCFVLGPFNSRFELVSYV